MYKIELNHEVKVFTVIIKGFMSDTEGIEYIKEFKEKLGKINPANYVIYLNPSKVTLSSGNLIDMAKLSYESFNKRIRVTIDMIIDAGFRRVFVRPSKNDILQLQFKRYVEQNNMTENIELVYSYNELLEKLDEERQCAK